MNNFTIKDLQNFEIDISLDSLLLSLIVATICSLVIKYVYKKFSQSINNKENFSNIFVLLAITTTIVITVVKFSLALSLGLVGALSIVRFRTPIKEPEELVFLFLSISIGIGYGANQIVITSSIFLVIIIIIWFFSPFYRINKVNDYNLIIEWPNENKIVVSDLIEFFKDTFKDIDLVKYEKSNTEHSIILNLNIINTQQIDKIVDELEKKYNFVKISFFESKQLY